MSVNNAEELFYFDLIMLHVTSLGQVLTSAVVSGNNCVSVVEMIQAQLQEVTERVYENPTLLGTRGYLEF